MTPATIGPATTEMGSKKVLQPDATGDASGSAEVLFADRLEESVALAASVVNHLSRVRASTINPHEAHNLLVFHGVGGVGKTALSRKLEAWLRRQSEGSTAWGALPAAMPEHVLTARWDLNNSGGNIDIVSMLVALRAGLVGSGVQWRAFDLAFSAYLSAVDPGETLNMRGYADLSGDLLEVLSGLASDFEVAGWAGSLATAALRPLLRSAVGAVRKHRELSRIRSLGSTLGACAQLQPGDASPELAAKVAWVLTEEIDALPADRRPLVVLFIDTFERVQHGDHVGAEAALNLLVAHLPYSLVVITGRNAVDWYRPSRTNLMVAGSRRWPSLVPGRTEEPRQHLLGRLSDEDALSVFRHRWAAGSWPMPETLLPALVEKTAGLPLHMDAVCKHADNVTSDGAEAVSAENVLHDLGDLVRRLVEDLTEEQSRAFHAACLLPYFDVALAAAVGGVTHSAVEACTRRALVEPNASSRFPYRVHDRIRELVRDAGREVKGGWSEADWKLAALRGFAEVERRHSEAASAGTDRETMEAIGQGLTLMVEYNLAAGWVAGAMLRTPTIRGLAPLVPGGDGDSITDGSGYVRLVHALNTPTNESVIASLREILESGTAASRQSGTWLVYRLRSLNRHEEALNVLNEMLELFPPHQDLYRHQYSVTLRMARRFREAIDYRAKFGLSGNYFLGYIRRHHGEDTNDLASRLDSARGEKSLRFGFEIETSALAEEARWRPISESAVQSIIDRAVNLGAPEREEEAWIIRGYQFLHQEAEFATVIDRLSTIARSRPAGGRPALTTLLAMRASVTGCAGDAERAWAEADFAPWPRPSAWILADFAMEMIGRPFPETPTQWLAPVDLVRDRYFCLIKGIIERSRIGEIVVS